MTEAVTDAVSDADRSSVHRQLGREPRGMVAVAHRCACGEPDVVTTAPRLPDGEPFPTVYYLTCPRAAGAIGTLEASGLMRRMQQQEHVSFIFSSHDPKVLEAADDAVHIHDGRITSIERRLAQAEATG